MSILNFVHIHYKILEKYYVTQFDHPVLVLIENNVLANMKTTGYDRIHAMEEGVKQYSAWSVALWKSAIMGILLFDPSHTKTW